MKSVFLFGLNNLRLKNNFALFKAIKNNDEVIPLFIFDKEEFESFNIYKKSFIYHSIKLIDDELKKHNFKLIIRYGKLITEVLNILEESKINNIYTNNYYKNKISILSKEYNYKLYIYDDLELKNKIKKQKISKFKNNFDINYKFNSCKYEISKLYNDNYLFSENINNYKFKELKKNNLYLNEKISTDNYDNLVLFICFGLVSSVELLKKLKKKNNFEARQIIDYIYFNEYKNLFLEYEIEPYFSENISLFVSLINSSTGNNLVNSIIKSIIKNKIINTYYLSIIINYSISRDINILWVENFLKNQIINFDENIFNSIIYNQVNDKELNKLLYNNDNLNFIKKYLNYKIHDYFYIYPYKIPVSMQNNTKFVIGKDFPEKKIKEKVLFL